MKVRLKVSKRSGRYGNGSPPQNCCTFTALEYLISASLTVFIGLNGWLVSRKLFPYASWPSVTQIVTARSPHLTTAWATSYHSEQQRIDPGSWVLRYVLGPILTLDLKSTGTIDQITSWTTSSGEICLGILPRRATFQRQQQTSLLTLRKARRDCLKTYRSNSTMASMKRKKTYDEPDDNKSGKKMKMQEDAGMIQGPDDASIRGLFTTLFYTINTFAQTYFQGAPYSIARKKDQKVFFEDLTGSNPTVYLKSKHPGVKEAIIVAAIWNALIRPLLSVPTKAFNEMMPEYAIKDRTSGRPLF